MLKFRIDSTSRSEAEALTTRFVNLVNALLPYGWRFHISPVPYRELPTLTFGATYMVSGRYVDVEGVGALESRDPFRTLEEQARPWQRRLRETLQRFIDSPTPILFYLTDKKDQGIYFDRYADRQLDVCDLEGTSPMDAGAGLAHALEEGLQRSQSGEFDYDTHHAAALVTEAQVMGGERLDQEARTRPANIDPLTAPPTQAYELWTPFRMPGGSIRAVINRMRGRQVADSRLAEFASLEAYQSAASGTAVWWPEAPLNR